MKQAVQPEDRKRERESTEFEQGWLPVGGTWRHDAGTMAKAKRCSTHSHQQESGKSIQ